MRLVVRSVVDNVIEAPTILEPATPLSKLYFNFEDGSPGVITVSRTDTTASYIDSNGVWQQASANTPRIHHDSAGNPLGLLAERQRVNKINFKNLNPSTTGGISVISGDGAASIVADTNTATIDGASLDSLDGDVSLQLTGGTAGTTYQLSATTGNTNKHCWRFAVRTDLTDGSNHGSCRIIGGTLIQFSSGVADGTFNEVGEENITPNASTRYLQVIVNAGRTIWIKGAQMEEYHQHSSIILTTDSGGDTRNEDVVEIATSDVPFEESRGGMGIVVNHSGAGVNTEDYIEARNAGATEVIGVRQVGTRGFVEGQYITSSLDQSTEESHKVLTNEDYPAFVIWDGDSVTSGGGRGMRFKRETGVTTPSGITTIELGDQFEGIIKKFVLYSNGKPSLRDMCSNFVGPNDVGVAAIGQSNIEGLSRVTGDYTNGGEIALISGLDNYYTTGTNFLCNMAIGGARLYYGGAGDNNYWLEDDDSPGPNLLNAVEAINASGQLIKVCFLNQWESDTSGNEATLKAGYKTLGDYVINNTSVTDIVMDAAGRRADYEDSNYNKNRRNYRDIASENANYHLAPASITLPLRDETGVSDGPHINDTGQQTKGLWLSRVAADIMGETVTGGIYGPTITGATRSGTTVTVTISHEAGSDFTPTSGIEGFRFEDDGVPINITAAVRVSATTIDLTLASTPTGVETLYYGYGTLYGVNPANLVVDNSTEAMPLQTYEGTL